MQKELEELQPKLVTAQDENARMMIVIEKENIEVEARSKVVRKDEEAANKEAEVAQALKSEVCVMITIIIVEPLIKDSSNLRTPFQCRTPPQCRAFPLRLRL